MAQVVGTASHVTCKPATIVPSATAPHEFLGYVSNHRWRGAASLPMKFCKRQGSGRCSAADRLPRLSVTEMIRMSHGLGMPGTAAETYCLERPKPVADSIVIGNRFGATNTSCLRPPEIATDTLSISRNIKYTQTPAETENIGSPETASGIGHTSYQFRPTYLLLWWWPSQHPLKRGTVSHASFFLTPTIPPPVAFHLLLDMKSWPQP
ncbi:hypothetical protein B0H14DRAFT_3575339 [Mycena olivaceomarginata]|nr:hypothetical protein B0H14DRAFT_3575339 [Mycena olivaceomarginata]